MFGIMLGAGLVVAGTAALVRHRYGIHRGAFSCVMRRLGVSPDQKRSLQSLVEEGRSRLSVSRDRARSLRRELADVLVAPEMDAARFESLESQFFEVVGEGTQVLRELTTRAHAILEPRQRQKLADWLRKSQCRHHHHACC